MQSIHGTWVDCDIATAVVSEDRVREALTARTSPSTAQGSRYLRWRYAMGLCSHEGRRRALLKIELIQSVETVLRLGDAQADGLLVKRARLDGVGGHITCAPGRQHVGIIGFGERE